VNVDRNDSTARWTATDVSERESSVQRNGTSRDWKQARRQY
jgi:hypothetical protein